MTRFGRLNPLLVYRDIQAAHDYLVSAFGFEPGRVDRAPDGEVVHGEVLAGDAVIWLHRVTDEHKLASPETVDMAGAGLVIFVDDVDEHFARAKAAGANFSYEPVDQPYGQREYEVRDLEGHRWWFATPIAVASRH